ncbi:unnamed protein product [Arabis nemorensis]|uniref:Uncharacterized protein n=1 Tax=Arabis nemorensis TaxID=586526 RepID=A0A565AUJ4_9BRAS|nr:unnamed protein product [Arabis nemorensis]
MVSMMDKRMELWSMESTEEFAALALRCSDDSPEMRRATTDVVKELEVVIIITVTNRSPITKVEFIACTAFSLFTHAKTGFLEC